MSSLLTPLMLLATMSAPAPNITYQVITDEFYQHNTYAYAGTLLAVDHDQTVYVLDIEACETRERLIYHNIIDEVVFLHKHNNTYTPRKNRFFLKKDFDRCLLTVKKNIRRNNMYYNHTYDYWYPNYNIIHITPKHHNNTRKRRHRIKRARYIYKPQPHPQHRVVLKHKHKKKPKIVVKKTKHRKKYNKK